MTDVADEPASAPSTGVAPCCLSIDLEVGIKDQRIHSFAAVRGDIDQKIVFKSGDLAHALAGLDDLAADAAFLLGHNIIAFDLPHLAAAKPDLRLLALPAVDTLRLNPLAFPRNPYHYLVKHYQDGRLQRGSVNDPELDARLTLDVFRDQFKAFQMLERTDPDLVAAWHWLTATQDVRSGLNAFFMTIRRQARPSDVHAHEIILQRLMDQGCQSQSIAAMSDYKAEGWPLAYALAWLSVAGGNSVMPPWVRHQFPKAGALIKALRDTPCSDAACKWCSTRHNPKGELLRWFGFSDFRAEPADANGRPLQESIVAAAMAGKHVLGILPTGTGKSLCYQIPALSRYDKTGALTVVISPLVALMADQVAGLEARGIGCCAAINGMLSMPERSDVMDRVRLGDIGILIVSPEQLRNQAVRKVLEQREIGAWVLDEAHCISKWGHDFRPDYRYVARFIKEKAKGGEIPPVLCLTATAKPDVVADMAAHFRDKIGIELTIFDGGANRTNLAFSVVPTTPAEKFAHIFQLLEADLIGDQAGGAIVYCASRKQTMEVAEFLRAKGLNAQHFHAGLAPTSKKTTQQAFLKGELRVIVATNAFGMGIDKPDVRVVIHADIPGSLENYLQEAGRAGRDREAARCVLLYTPEDIERQFSMSARSRLTRLEIQAILKSLKTLDRRKRMNGEVVATSGEILAEESNGAFERDSATDDTRVRTAVSWLEEAGLLTREENRVQIFPSSLRVGSLEEARIKLGKAPLFADRATALLALVRAMITADPDEGISTDELMGVSGLSPEQVRASLYDLEKLGIASNETALTAFVHVGMEDSSQKKFAQSVAMEVGLIDALRIAAPDLQKGDASRLQLRHTTQHLKDAGHPTALPEKISRLINSLAGDGRSGDDGVGSIRIRRLDRENLEITLQRDWPQLQKTADLRRNAAALLLAHLINVLPLGARGADQLSETTLGKLQAVLDGDLVLKASVRDTGKLLDRALLWLHEQEVIRLNKGLAIFRPAMTIHLSDERRNFQKADFAPLMLHYTEKVTQIHVMAEYVAQGLQAMANALRLTRDYFTLEREAFIAAWLPQRERELARQTTPASWRAIVEDLNNPIQQRIVADDREQVNVLVLAGPGSGKTRVLVHRIAYLIRVKRENPHGILALAYNRHAAAEIRLRLAALIGDDARGVIILTCHAFAMRLTGVSFSKAMQDSAFQFDNVMRDAIALLKGDGLPTEEADEQRDRLLAAFRWILVDEYQDIGEAQYELISALAGRTRQEDDSRLTLFAVGDDDQNIYAFNGASIKFIRQFEIDYKAKPTFLIENYRSTQHIVVAANRVIGAASERMKTAFPITVDRARQKQPAGGAWQVIDPIGRGQVQILQTGATVIDQALAVMTELQRLASLSPDWRWDSVAVIACEWKFLTPLHTYCELHGIPVQMGNEEAPPFWRLRETQLLVSWLRKLPNKIMATDTVKTWLATQAGGTWWSLLDQAIDEYALETAGSELPLDHCIEWLAEWGREVRRRQSGLLLLTAHRAKGLEFDHVAVLDGGWNRIEKNVDGNAQRRLYYVAMTRARNTLLLVRQGAAHPFIDALVDAPGMLMRTMLATVTPAEMRRTYRTLTLKDVNIDFAGRFIASARIHAAIAALSAGDSISLQQTGPHWELYDASAQIIGRLSRSFEMPAGERCIAARVVAIVTRRLEDATPEFQSTLKIMQWELVLPELVYEPDKQIN